MKWVRWTLGEWVWVWKSLSESPYESEWECPYQTECEMSLSESPYQNVPIKLSVKCPYQKVPIKLSLSNCPYQNVHIKISILPFMIQIVVLLELGWASIQQPIIKSIILIDLNEHLKNLEDSRTWRIHLIDIEHEGTLRSSRWRIQRDSRMDWFDNQENWIETRGGSDEMRFSSKLD